MYYSKEGVELLAAGVLKSAYIDLIDARLADAAHEFRNKSFNCTEYYKKLHKGKSTYGVGTGGRKTAKQDIERLERWFRSEKCKVFCVNISGQWFIDIAKKKTCAFAQDRIPIWEATPSFDTSIGTGGNAAGRKRDYEEWKARRDKWREDHNLVEVK